MRNRILATLALGLGLATLAAGTRARGDDEQRLLRCAPVVGFDGPHVARVWLSPTDAKAAVAVAYVASDGDERRVAMPPVKEGCISSIVKLEGLKTDTDYAYKVLVGDARAAAGSFHTAPEPGKPFHATIAVTSCMNVRKYPRQVAWEAMRALEPRLLVQLGDNVYANSTKHAVQYEWFLEQRNVPEYVRLLSGLSTLAVWDDHDFGANDSDGTLPGKEESLEVFRELWPNPAGGVEGTPGVFFEATYGDVDLFLLDTRYDRAPNDAPIDRPKPMLAEAQWQWLEKGLRASKATFKLVCSGSTIEASFKDYWGMYPRELERLYRNTQSVPGIVFCTGDVHRSLVMKSQNPNAGYPIYEVVSSGIAVEEGPFSFVTLDIDTTGDEPKITCHVVKVALDGSVLENKKRTIKASELRVPD